MENTLKTQLDAARAETASLHRQRENAERAKIAVIARRQPLQTALNAAGERMEQARIGYLRGVVAEADQEAARAAYSEAKAAIEHHEEEEAAANRACDLSSEMAAARAALDAARTRYFDAIAGRIEKSLGSDAKLRTRLMAAWAAAACSQGRTPDTLQFVNWGGILEAIFPAPSESEMLHAHAAFVAEHDAAAGGE